MLTFTPWPSFEPRLSVGSMLTLHRSEWNTAKNFNTTHIHTYHPVTKSEFFKQTNAIHFPRNVQDNSNTLNVSSFPTQTARRLFTNLCECNGGRITCPVVWICYTYGFLASKTYHLNRIKLFVYCLIKSHGSNFIFNHGLD